jgi:hypothetical protein
MYIDHAHPNASPVLASPADCPFLRGYGDDLNIESTRPEKSVSKDWNLLGLRGTEAIQVSSHRGPPTDRPPDKPVETSVFAGCSEERPNTRRTYQLASFACRPLCLSGKVAPYADNAILGCHAIKQYCVHAVGTSQRSQSGAELDASEVWTVQGQSGLCVVRRHPPVNQGRNLFPLRLKSGEVFFPHPIQQVQWHSELTGSLGT